MAPAPSTARWEHRKAAAALPAPPPLGVAHVVELGSGFGRRRRERTRIGVAARMPIRLGGCAGDGNWHGSVPARTCSHGLGGALSSCSGRWRTCRCSRRPAQAREVFAGDDDGEAVIEPAVIRPNPVIQAEMDAGSIELF